MASSAGWPKKHKICQSVFPLFLLSLKDWPTRLPICPFNSSINLCTQILSSVIHLGYIHACFIWTNWFIYSSFETVIHWMKCLSLIHLFLYLFMHPPVFLKLGYIPESLHCLFFTSSFIHLSFHLFIFYTLIYSPLLHISIMQSIQPPTDSSVYLFFKCIHSHVLP